MSECSREFYSAFCHSGSLVITCNYCDRTYFGRGGDYEDGELEELQAKAEKEPDKYREREDFTSYFNFNGRQCVFDCPCGASERIEALIWNNRHDIAEYLNARAKLELADATRDKALLSQPVKALNEPTPATSGSPTV